MGKKRTGLQGSISAIFSGVPIPKKGQPGSEPPAPAGKPDASAGAKPPAPQPRVPTPPSAPPAAARPAVQPIPEIAPRVIPTAAPERKVSPVPSKVPRRQKSPTRGPGAGVSRTRQGVSIALIVILSVLLFVLLGKPFGGSRPGPAAPGGSVGPAVAAAAPRANVKIDWPVPQVYPADKRDPMAWGTQQVIVPQTPDTLAVTAITTSEDRKIANVGTQMLSEGDTVPGTTIKVKTIELNRVEFEDEMGKTWWQEVQATKN